MTYKLVTIVGARPQFIKAAALSRELCARDQFNEILVHTGQHYDADMSDVFFQELDIPKPKYQLDINGASHGEMTGRMLIDLELILLKEKPAAVIVYGDTNSTLAGALAASKLHIPVIHVEAGLRSFNKKMPEEINRVLTDHVSDMLFCPTETAVDNLKREHVSGEIQHVGDVMYDATLYAKEYVNGNPSLLSKFDFIQNDYAILTIHRQASTGSIDMLSEMLKYVEESSSDKGVKVIFPAHPRTRQLLTQISFDEQKIKVFEPVSYFEMHGLLNGAQQIYTDSGGLQKEAYFHQVPCITLRSETEWTETVESGWNQLWKDAGVADTNRSLIKGYGQGDAALKICNLLDSYLGKVL